MRHDDADEADQPTHRNCRRGAERRRQHHDESHAMNVHTEGACFIVADSQHINQSAMQQQHHAAYDDIRKNQAHIAPRCGGEATKNPRIHLAHDVVVALQDKRLYRGGERGDRHPRQHQGSCRPSRAERRADHIGERHGDEPSDECRKWHRVDEPPLSDVTIDDERHRGTEPRPGGNSEQIRVDERVAKCTLVTRTGNRQHRPNERSKHHPWSANLPHDVPLRVVDAAVNTQERQSVKQRQRHAPPHRTRRPNRRADNCSDEHDRGPAEPPRHTLGWLRDDDATRGLAIGGAVNRHTLRPG